MTNDNKPPQDVTFTVDNVEFTVNDKHQTAGGILTAAGLDPAMYDLAKLHGDGAAFKDDQQVIVHDGDAFVTPWGWVRRRGNGRGAHQCPGRLRP